MRIAQISTPWEHIPPAGYAGTERVVGHLTDALVARGHDVTLYAPGDSISRARVRSCFPVAQKPYNLDDLDLHTAFAYRDIRDSSFDIIHSHVSPGIRYAPLMPIPTLHTVHSVLGTRRKQAFVTLPSPNLVAISYAQRDSIPEIAYSAVVYNGVETNVLTPGAHDGGYLLHMGTLTDYKGSHHAVTVARRTGLRLILAGVVPAFAESFFQCQIKPYIDDRQITFVGEVGGRQRVTLLQQAMAVLVPIEWNEPFGLVMAEAMACGTPVIAFRKGSAPELVRHGVTGYVVDTIDDMIAAVRKVETIDPQACRDHAVAHFSLEQMAAAYEQLYQRLVT